VLIAGREPVPKLVPHTPPTFALWNFSERRLASQASSVQPAKVPEAIIRTLAFTSCNPAIGRVLGKGGVGRFAELMVKTIPKLFGATVRKEFDALHDETCDAILADFKKQRRMRCRMATPRSR
jgi:hypothetical protein